MTEGDYVRTKKGIAKIIDRINDPTNYYDKFWVCDRYLELNDDTEYIHEQDIIGEPKGKIIELIEVGDILVIKDFVDEACMIFTDIYLIQNEEQLLHIKNDLEKNKNKMLYSIVTKEMFSSIEYEVKQ